jgi:transketolase
VRTDFTEENLCAYGAYDLVSASDAEVTIFATGSEIEIALEARQMLEANGHTTRVVSVPSFELFEEQSMEYKKAVIGDSRVKIAIEAAYPPGMGPLYRFRRLVHRHDRLRRIGTLQGTLRAFRHHRRSRSGRGRSSLT